MREGEGAQGPCHHGNWHGRVFLAGRSGAGGRCALGTPVVPLGAVAVWQRYAGKVTQVLPLAGLVPTD